MSNGKRSATKGCLIAAAVIVGVPLMIVGVVGIKTCGPLQKARDTLVELEESLGSEAAYVPSSSGAIPADRMEVFLELRQVLVLACSEYGLVQEGFDSVEALEEKDPGDPKDVGGVAVGLGGAALSITPFLARFFERRNDALLAASMGLEEYAYIYAVAYQELLLSERIRNEIFSDGAALSPEASVMLRGCLARQLEAGGGDRTALEAEMKTMEGDPARLIWQDGLPDAVRASVAGYRDRLDHEFCAATAGLELERSARRALRIALE